MAKETRCRICGEAIDKGACGQAFTIITIKDDRANDPAKYKEKRTYLCDNCTSDLELFLFEREREPDAEERPSASR